MDPAEQLDRLAAALNEAGWATRRRYGQIPVLIHVFHPEVPVLGDSISVEPSFGTVPWFKSSTGELLAPCDDLPLAVEQIAKLLGPYVKAARTRQRGQRHVHRRRRP